MKIHRILYVLLLLIVSCKKDTSESQELETTWILKDWFRIYSSNLQSDTSYMLQNGTVDTTTPLAVLSWDSIDPVYELALEDDKTYSFTYTHDDTTFSLTGNWNLLNNILILDRPLFSYSVKGFTITELRDHEMTLASPDTLFLLDSLVALGAYSRWRFEEKL